MGVRYGIVILFILGASWACNCQELDSSSIFAGVTDISFDSVLQVNKAEHEKETQVLRVGKKENLCTLCEEFASEALSYLAANRTQTEIIDILHKSCSKVHAYKQECLVLVDYYAPLFFLEISSIQPGDFCQKVNLCEQVALISKQISKNTCDFCQNTIADALMKLKDPETELGIIEVVLKACKSLKGYEKKCKRIVFEYGPIILLDAEHLLESKDICTAIHACNRSTKEAVTAETVKVAIS